MGQTSPRREKAPSRPHPRPAMWYLSSWRNLPWRSNAGHGLLNKPEITPPSHSNHCRDGTEGFAETVNSCQYLLPRLDDFGLLRAIHEPAILYDGQIDSAVGDHLMFTTRQQ